MFNSKNFSTVKEDFNIRFKFVKSIFLYMYRTVWSNFLKLSIFYGNLFWETEYFRDQSASVLGHSWLMDIIEFGNLKHGKTLCFSLILP